jgi:site-specific DNA-methyltransferase (adenine-specific)
MNMQFISRNEKSSDLWETPLDFFEPLNREFHFTLDACASHENHLLPKYFTIETNGLIQSWEGECVFINPPFSTFSAWIEKAYFESKKNDITIVMIIPSRTDTKAWHNFAMKANQIRFCIPRVNFLLNKQKTKNGSTFPLSIIVFQPNKNPYPSVSSYYWKEQSKNPLKKGDVFFY